MTEVAVGKAKGSETGGGVQYAKIVQTDSSTFYAIGGNTQHFLNSEFNSLKSCLKINIKRAEVLKRSEMMFERDGHNVCAIGHHIYAIGGRK